MVEKLEMMSSNIIQENIDYIAEKFPNALKEVMENGKLIKKIDFDVLKQELSAVVIDDKQERYQMTWPDKKKSILLANSRINATLRPVKEKSIDFDKTKNLYIEGDNLDVLKLLRETYLDKVKVIYIDPPYNTGNDFVYEDDFILATDEYLANSGQYDEQGNRLVQNSDSNGRFHTDWLNMMYPRLKIAKDLLSIDGVIAISIDDHEVENMKKICNEILGEKNFLACVVWERAFSPVNLKKHFSESHDYILFYAKNINETKCNGLQRSSEADDRYSNPDNDPRGVWTSSDVSVGPRIEKNVYEIKAPSGRVILPPSGRCWSVSEDRFIQLIKENRVWFGENGDNIPRFKRFLKDVKQGMTPMTIWKYADVGHSQDATKKLKELFDNISVFDYSKPVNLIKRIIELYSDDESIILDFFSGSATTAHAVMELNNDRKTNMKFIMVQLPEKVSVNTQQFDAGYRTICDIGIERIKRASHKIRKESGVLWNNIDDGFRVLKLDSSNMNDVYYNPNMLNQNMLDQLVGNVKEDRTPLDLLFQVMLELGIELSAKIEEKELLGKKYFVVNENDIVACFDDGINDEIVKELAKIHSIYAVFKDSAFDSDSSNINCEQIFKSISPSTTIKVV